METGFSFPDYRSHSKGFNWQGYIISPGQQKSPEMVWGRITVDVWEKCCERVYCPLISASIYSVCQERVKVELSYGIKEHCMLIQAEHRQGNFKHLVVGGWIQRGIGSSGQIESPYSKVLAETAVNNVFFGCLLSCCDWLSLTAHRLPFLLSWVWPAVSFPCCLLPWILSFVGLHSKWLFKKRCMREKFFETLHVE